MVLSWWCASTILCLAAQTHGTSQETAACDTDKPVQGSAMLQAKAPLSVRAAALKEDSLVEVDSDMFRNKRELELSESELEARIDAIMAEEAATFVPLPSLEFEKDLTLFPDHHYLAFSQGKTLHHNIDDAIEHFLNTTEITNSMTVDEVEAFTNRVKEELALICKHEGITEENGAEDPELWREVVEAALEDQKPAVTQAAIDACNQAGAGYGCHYQDYMLMLSTHDIEESHGLEPEEPIDDAKVLLEKRNVVKQRLLGLQTAEERAVRSKAEFDASTNWAACADVIFHIRDQGRCGSCWAFAAATAIDGRLCIASDGAFAGPSSYVSAGYLASCVKGPGKDGCGGGDPGVALKYMADRGSPTGFSSATGCSPYWGSGDATQHMSGGKIRSPACPSTCEVEGYPRSLQEDLIIPKALRSTRLTFSLDQSKAAVLRQGPVPIALLATRAFHYYSTGVFNPGCNLRPNHAVTMYGWGRGHVKCINSYGTTWGNGGKFLLADCAVSFGYNVPDIAGSGDGYPFPLPNGNMPRGDTPRRRRTPVPPLPRVTTEGCECKQNWLDTSSGGTCNIYCCNPDSDPSGEWCFVSNKAACGKNWGYCAPAGGGDDAPEADDAAPEPAPTPTPPPVSTHGWSVPSGPCMMDSLGCIKSGNYPQNYAPDEACTISFGDAKKFLEVKNFNTEGGFDILTVNGVEYSGSTQPSGQAIGTAQWSSDSSGEKPGWKICPSDEAVAPPPAPPAPATRRRWQPPAAPPTAPPTPNVPDGATGATRRRWQPPTAAPTPTPDAAPPTPDAAPPTAPPTAPDAAATRRRYVAPPTPADAVTRRRWQPPSSDSTRRRFR